jgi:hypothetical protein
MSEECKPVKVSRRIQAPADRIFEIIADPRRHLDIDGSDMLRGAASKDVISSVGDVFSMRMYLESLGGDYLMLNQVVEYDPDRRISWEPAAGDYVASQGGRFPVGDPPGHRWSFILTPDGADATVVTEIYDCTAAPPEVRTAVSNGETWIESMTTTLARLDALCGQ